MRGLLVEVGLVALLLVVLAALARRLGTRGHNDAVKVVRLTAQHGVHLVELEGRRLVIGTGPTTSPTLLCELERSGSTPTEPHVGAG